MTKLSIIVSFIAIFVIFACKNSKADQINKEAKSLEIVENRMDTTGMVRIDENKDIKKERAKAMEILMNFKPSDEFPVFLDSKYYLVDYISEVGKTPRDIIDLGEWFKFNPDYSYEHGFFEKLNTKGKFVLGDKNRVITLVPDSELEFPEQFNLLSSGDVLVLSGTNKFDNNSYQKHMVEVDNKPEIVK